MTKERTQTLRREPLTRERIIEAAMRLMDKEGLEAVTMRRIGRELGVEAMSLYNHVADKEDILSGVVEAVMGEYEFPRFR
jgi:AcrR family transcriptional regulator